MVLVVPVVLCNEKNREIEGRLRHSGIHICFQVTLTGLAVVDGVEEEHGAGDQLEHRRNSGLLGLHVLVLPPPPGTAHGSHHRLGGLVAATNPGTDLANLHLPEGGVS